MEPKLKLDLGRDATDAEQSAVLDAFGPDKVEVVRSHVRLSDDWQQLPLAIYIFARELLPNAAWDAIKLAAKKLFLDKRIKREPQIVVYRSEDRVVMTRDGAAISSAREFIKFSSLDELREYESKK